MSEKVFLVTGGTSGIGRSTAVELARRGGIVVITARDEAKGQEAQKAIQEEAKNGKVELLVLDLSSQASIKKAASDFHKRFKRLDVLINNAGVSLFTRQFNAEGYEANFATNYLGPFVLTQLLLETLKKSAPSRIINVASAAMSKPDLADLMNERNFVPMTVYAQTKAENILFTYSLARRLEGTGVTVNCLHPGVVRTNLARDARGLFKVLFAVAGRFFVTPVQGAETSVYLATSDEVATTTGQYFVKKTPARSELFTYDEALQKGLWEATEKLIR